MPLEEILKNIEEETKKQEESIISEAMKQAEQIIKDAEIKAQTILEDSKKRAKIDGENIKRQIISSAMLESRNQYEREIEKIENNILQLLTKSLQEFTKTNDYDNFLYQKVKLGWELLGPGSIIYANQRDIERIRKFSLPLNIIEKEVDPIGGIIITSADGKMEVDFTMSELLMKKMEELLKKMKDYIVG